VSKKALYLPRNITLPHVAIATLLN